ncbi:MAG: hypothetical protein EU530_00440 [Promethearchaeota archaeon]|nr:MAG: hypothetical protein EU530_00440 [Candidatus Lokiarchaeota archaeon]
MDFFWLIPQKIAGGSLPKVSTDFISLQNNKIQHIISLVEDTRDISTLVFGNQIKLHHIPIQDWGIPSHSQIQRFLSIVKENLANNEATYVHCHGGCGRTGTMLAIFLVESGYAGEEALKKIRDIRPCSVETEEQERLVLKFQP